MLNPILLKLGIAVLVGGIIGLEHEFQYKAAGFRTIILITIGSALYTLFSISITGTTDSAMRIAPTLSQESVSWVRAQSYVMVGAMAG